MYSRAQAECGKTTSGQSLDSRKNLICECSILLSNFLADYSGRTFFIKFQTSKECLAVSLFFFNESWLAMSSTGMSDMFFVSLRLNWLLPELEKPPLI